MMLAAVDAGDVSAHHLFFSAQLRDTIVGWGLRQHVDGCADTARAP